MMRALLISRNETGVDLSQRMLFRQQHQILGRAHQKLVVAGSTFQNGTGIGAEAVQLRADGRDQTADGIVVVILNGLQLLLKLMR